MRLPKMNFDSTELRLVNEDDGDQGTPSENGEPRDHADLVSEVIGEQGCSHPTSSTRCAGRRPAARSRRRSSTRASRARSASPARLPSSTTSRSSTSPSQASTPSVEVDRAARARARLRDPLLRRGRSPQGRDHRSLRTCRGSTSCGSRPAGRSSSTSRRRTTSSPSCAASRAPPRRRTPPSSTRPQSRSCRGGRPRGRRRHLRRAARPARQLDHLPGRRGGRGDIHVEPQEHDLIVRYRIDGVLHVAQTIPKLAGVTTRLKVLAKLDIAERRKPQDGRITLTAASAGRLLDIRVATLPTVEGETVTMRLLDKSRESRHSSLSASRTTCVSARGSSPARRARCS